MKLFLAIAALAALSCAPEVELSGRDWEQITADKDAAPVSEDSLYMTPVISRDNTINSVNQVKISFPDEADILRENNVNIVNKMSEFIKFYPYSKGDSTSDYYTLEKEKKYDYTFESRRPDKDNRTIITVKLNSYDGSGSLVGQVLAGAYTFAGGKKLCGSGDTQAGDDYYDTYTTLQRGANSADFSDPYKDWSIDISLPSYINKDSSVYANIVTANGIPSEFEDEIMSALKSKLSFKLTSLNENDSAWQNVSEREIKYDNKAIQVIFTPTNFTVYRVEVGGIENLTTSAAYYGVTQRIKVSVNDDTAVFSRKAVTVERAYYDLNGDYTLAPADLISGSLIRDISIESINNGKKTPVLRVKFVPIIDPVSSDYAYPQEISLSEFKSNVKIFIVPGGKVLSAMDDVVGVNNEIVFNEIVFLDINKIFYYGGSSGSISIEFNSAPRFETGVSLGFLIAPGFRYSFRDSNKNVIFGNYDNWRYEIDGVRNFDFYGTYSISGNYIPDPVWPPFNYTPLASGEWQEGSIVSTSSSAAAWYSFYANSGTTYYIWWNDSDNFSDHGQNYMDIMVDAYYSDETVLFTGSNNNERNFTANRSDTVYVKVYSRDSVTGSFGVAYGTRDVKPEPGPLTSYTVDFSVNGGNGTPPASQTVDIGSDITLPLGTGLSKVGYAFGGWSIYSSGAGDVYRPGTSYTPDGNIIIYAKWNDVSVPLTEDTWQNTGKTSVDVWFLFNVTSGTTYYLWWNDRYEGDGAKTADIYVSAYYNGGTPIFISEDAAWDYPKNFTADRSDMVYVKVTSSYTGTYGIVYSAGSVKPDNPNDIPLTENVWKDDRITSGSEEVNYSITVAAGTTYYVWWNDSWAGDDTKTADIQVSASYSDGTAIFTNMNSAWDYPKNFTAAEDGKVIMKVYAYDHLPNETGTYSIVYSTVNTRP